jgi:hypothetical protein
MHHLPPPCGCRAAFPTRLVRAATTATATIVLVGLTRGGADDMYVHEVQKLAGPRYGDLALETALQHLHTVNYDVQAALATVGAIVEAALNGTCRASCRSFGSCLTTTHTSPRMVGRRCPQVWATVYGARQGL